MSNTFRLTVLLTTLFFYHMVAVGSSTALATPATPPLERVASVPTATPSLPGESWSANMVTKGNIRWTLNGNYKIGQFVTGDWYVVAPSGLQVTAITALNSKTLRGSQKNPRPTFSQGLTSTGHNLIKYDPALNVGLRLPISLSPGDNLVTGTVYVYNTTDQTDLDEGAILTVVSSTPSATAFRPGICDTGHIIYDSNAIDYSQLKRYAPVSGAPSIATLQDQWARPWIDYYPSWSGRSIHPLNNMKAYGGKLVTDISNAALVINSDYTQAQKEPIVIGMIQYGIDVYSAIKYRKSTYQQTVAHMLGRKFPVMLAGELLNIAEIKAIWPKTGKYLHKTWGSYPGDAIFFEEDQAIEYVTQNDVNVTSSGTAQYQPDYDYTSGMIGMPEWFHHKYNDRGKGNSSWNTDPYRTAYYSGVLYGSALATYMMGWEGKWNHPAYFEYLDRYNAIQLGQAHPWPAVSGESKGARAKYNSAWAVAMWDKYRKNF